LNTEIMSESKKMKILQVVHGFPPEQKTGVEILTYNLCGELSRTCEVHVFYPKYKEAPGGKCYINSFNKDGIIIHELITELNSSNKLKRLFDFEPPLIACENQKAVLMFEELLARVNPDIVHFQHMIGFSVLFPIIAKRNFPVVLSLNDYWLLCPTTHFLRFDGKICFNASPDECFKCVFDNTWIKGSSGKNNAANFLLEFIKKLLQSRGKNKIIKRLNYSKKAVKSVDKVIVSSQCVKKTFIDRGFISDEDFTVKRAVSMPYGIDISSLSNVKKNDYDKIRFGYVGGMAKRKGVGVLIDGFKKLDNAGAQLWIYGKIDMNDPEQKRLFEENSGNINIKFMGDFSDIKEPYSNIDVLVVPSITYEGFGLVIFEAFAAGIPVISSDISALNEFVQNMINGLLFKPGSSDDLAEKMRVLVENKDILPCLKKNFPVPKSISLWAEEIVEIYEDLLNKKRGKS